MSQWHPYGLELHEQRLAELAAAAAHHHLVRQIEGAEPEQRERLAGLRRALAAAGATLVHIGRRLELAAHQPPASPAYRVGQETRL